MQLAALLEELRRELATDRVQNRFNDIKQDHAAFRKHPTLFSVLAALESQAGVGYEAQDQLIRALVAEAQAHPDERLWRQILLYAFLPGLIGIRARAIQGEHESEDLDALVWTVFYEMVHAYSLQRPGSIAAGLLLDTRKRILRALTLEQEIRRHERALVDYARRVSSPGAEPFDLADHMEPAPFTLEPADREEIRLALQRCRGLSPEDVELVLAVDVDGLTIPQYMQTRGLATGDRKVDARERDRLAHRRLRARERLRHFFQKN
jgi:hypothetical protein